MIVLMLPAKPSELPTEVVDRLVERISFDENGFSLPDTPSSDSATRFSRQLREIALTEIAESGTAAAASRRIGMCSNTISKAAADCPVFKAALDWAMALYRDAIMDEIDRRGRRGVEKPVWYKGEEVGTEVHYSDRLLEFHAKRHMPEYRDRQEAKDVTVSAVVVVGPAPVSADDWLDENNGVKKVENTADDD